MTRIANCFVRSCNCLARFSVVMDESLNNFHAGGRCSDWKFRVINRAPLLKVKYDHPH
jgi:hypothetical protein